MDDVVIRLEEKEKYYKSLPTNVSMYVLVLNSFLRYKSQACILSDPFFTITLNSAGGSILYKRHLCLQNTVKQNKTYSGLRSYFC